MTSRLLSLDLSNSVGWALLERGVRPRFGTLKLPPETDHGRRFIMLRDWLSEARSVMGFDAIAYEQPILPRKSGDLATTMNTLEFLWGLAAMVKAFASERGMRCEAVGVQEAKIALTNRQHATKEEMVVAAMRVMNWAVSNDHEADAGAVGLVAYERLWPKARAA